MKTELRYVSISICPPDETRYFFETLERAVRARQAIDDDGCGGSCMGPQGHWVLDTVTKIRYVGSRRREVCPVFPEPRERKLMTGDT